MVTDTLRRHGPALGLAALLGTSGAIHLVRPRVFRGLVPRVLGDPGPWVLGSGVVELGCAAALVVPRTRQAGGLASVVLLVGVFPGNVTMAVRSPRRLTTRTAVAWARLPVQVPLVAWAWSVYRGAAR